MVPGAARELTAFEAFRDLSPSGLALLEGGYVRHAFARSAAVIHKGQPVSGAYIVLRGRLRVFTVAPNGTEATLYFIGPGETCVLALNCLFNDVLYPAWVQAESAAAIALIPGPTYRRLFETEFTIQNLTVRTLASLVYRLMSELDHVHMGYLRERLAQFVLTHAASDGVLRMTQQEIAGHLGTTREGIARVLRELVVAGLVESQRGRVRIRDLFGLRRVVAPDPVAAGQRRRD